MKDKQKGSGAAERTRTDSAEVGGASSSPPLPQIETGVVAWFNDSRGMGFLARDNHQRDAFVHYSQIDSAEEHKTLKKDQRVEFQVAEERKGPRAVNVKVIG